jgi:hypothetical protein
MTPLFVLPFTLLVVLAGSTSGDKNFVKPLHCTEHHPIRIVGELERLVTAWPVMTKSRAPAGGNNYPKNGLEKRRDVTHEPSAQPACSEERRRSA